jgi:hypothetical protein
VIYGGLRKRIRYRAVKNFFGFETDPIPVGRVKVIDKINFRIGVQPHQIKDAYLRTIEQSTFAAYLLRRVDRAGQTKVELNPDEPASETVID